MTTIELAKAKYAAKMARAGPRWKKRVTDKVSDYAKGVARFLGISDISSDKKTAWSEGVGRVSADEFQRAVSGKETRWADRLREAFA